MSTFINNPTEEKISVDNAVDALFTGEPANDAQTQPEQIFSNSQKTAAANPAANDPLQLETNNATIETVLGEHPNGTNGVQSSQHAIMDVLTNNPTQTNKSVTQGDLTVASDGTVQNAAGDVLNDDDIIKLSATKRVELDNGDVISASELINMRGLKPRYDKAVSENNYLKQELTKTKEKDQAVQDNLEWLKTAANDKVATSFLTNLRNGVPQEEALRSAVIAGGLGHLFESAKQSIVEQGPPQPGTERYFRASSKELGLQPGDAEYDEWLSGNLRQTVADQNAADRKTLLAEIDQRERTKQEAEESVRREREHGEKMANDIANSNKNILSLLPTVLAEEGIDIAQLTQQGKDELGRQLTEKAAKIQLNIDDDGWMKQHVLTEGNIIAMVGMVDRSKLQTIGQAQAKKPVEHTSVNAAAQQGAGTTTANPTLIRSEVDKLHIKPINAGPASNGAAPVESQNFEMTSKELLEQNLMEMIGDG